MKDINLVLENIVYMELLRRGYTVTVGKAGDKEIDFVCEDQGNKLYIQVAYLLASEDTIKREFGVYDRVRDNFPKYVVTLATESSTAISGTFCCRRNGTDMPSALSCQAENVFCCQRKWEDKNVLPDIAR